MKTLGRFTFILPAGAVFLLSSWFSVPATAEVDWSRVVCPSDEVLATELLEMEISGAHYEGGVQSKCLAQNRFKFVQTMTPQIGEAPDRRIRAPDLLDEHRPFEVRKLQMEDEGRIKADIVFRVRTSDGTVVRRRDSFIFRRYYRDAKALWGCGGIIEAPMKRAFRGSCLVTKPGK